jgi:hypothetical protein
MTVQSPAFAIALSIWARNRMGYLLCAAGLAAMALFYPALFAYSRSPETLIASTTPLVVIFSFLLNSAIFAQQPGSLSSSYPRHMFVLPVKSSTLVFWPMLYGTLIAVVPWVFTAVVIYRSSGLTIPVIMPALILVVVVPWFQALAWAPLAQRWLRDLFGITLTLALGAIPVCIIVSDPGARIFAAAVLFVYFVLACALAFAGVRAERRGDAWVFWPRRASADRAADVRHSGPFGSAAQAQFWYEWRCHALPIVVYLGGLMFWVWTVVVAVGKPIQGPLFPLILGLLLAAPCITIGSIGPGIARFRPFWIENRRNITFITVRPMGSGAIVAAKMRMALVTVLLSWAYILAGTAACVVLSRSLPAAILTWRRFASLYPDGRAPLICGLACVLMPAVMWKLLTDGFPFVLTGRKWLADGAVWLYLAGLIALAAGGIWLGNHREHLPRLIAIAPWLAALVAALKASVTTAAYRLAVRRELMGWPAIWRILAGWSVFTGIAFALVLLVAPPSALVSRPVLLLGIATFVPLARFPLATLAFDWNRHR